MTPEEQRRAAESERVASRLDLERTRNLLDNYEYERKKLQERYDYLREKAQEKEPQWADLTGGQMVVRLVERMRGIQNAKVHEFERSDAAKSLKRVMGEYEQQQEQMWEYCQKYYGIQPNDRAALDRVIAEKGRPLPPVPTMAEQHTAKLAAQVEAQQQAAPEPAQAAPTPQPREETKPTAQQQAQHEQEFHRQMDQHYESQPPSQPTPAPHQPGHLKDEAPTKTDEQEQQPPPTETNPTSHPHQKIPLIDRYKDDTPEEEHQPAQEREPTDTQEDTHADWEALKQEAAQQRMQARDPLVLGNQLKEMEQGIKQMNDDMTREQQQQEKSGPWKTPLRALYDLGPEPPQQEPGPDRSH